MDNKITYFTRKENQYFLTREEIHNTFQKYIQDYKGKVITKKNVTFVKAKVQKSIKTDWSHASARKTENGMKLTYLTEVI